VSLVQALLLLTYYYETPDDQKDTWHWMGVATSVAHTIGLHRNPEHSSMDNRRAKLWKRIWWSTYMRDRLIALGMRRPTRIKEEDYDVPMITLDDFEFVSIPENITCVPASCTIARDLDKQRELAIMCIEKAKLCLCISHILSKQYCVLNNNQGMVNDRTTMMLLPKKLDPETTEVKICDDELQNWLENLPAEAKQKETLSGDASIDLHRSLLHLVFFTTLSALHRPQVLPAAPATGPMTKAGLDLLDISRQKVRRAAGSITTIAQSIYHADLAKYLPTTGVTVLLPAIIIHLLDIKSTDRETRLNSLRGFCACMTVMSKLRDMYAAADYSTAFLEAAIRKAGIQVATLGAPNPTVIGTAASPRESSVDESAGMHPVMTVEDLVDAGRRLDTFGSGRTPMTINTLTPPPDNTLLSGGMSSIGFATDLLSNSMPAPSLPLNHAASPEDDLAVRLNSYLASTPPSTSSSHSPHSHYHSPHSQEEEADETASLGTTLVHGPSMSRSTFDMSSMSAHARMFHASMMPDLSSVNRATTSTMTEFGTSPMLNTMTIEEDFDALVDLEGVLASSNVEGLGGGWNFDDGGVHGFTIDMDWFGMRNPATKKSRNGGPADNMIVE
jgi:Fungal specific transcription factor domain